VKWALQRRAIFLSFSCWSTRSCTRSVCGCCWECLRCSSCVRSSFCAPLTSRSSHCCSGPLETCMGSLCLRDSVLSKKGFPLKASDDSVATACSAVQVIAISLSCRVSLKFLRTGFLLGASWSGWGGFCSQAPCFGAFSCSYSYCKCLQSACSFTSLKPLGTHSNSEQKPDADCLSLIKFLSSLSIHLTIVGLVK
jgi:hypothetical protein